MRGIRITGNTSSNDANANVSSSLTINFGKDESKVGYMVSIAENDAGTYTGTASYRPAWGTTDFRAKLGVATLTFDSTFNYLTPDYGKWVFTTGSGASAGAFTFSSTSGSIVIGPVTTAAGQGAMIKTCRTFPVVGNGRTYVSWTATFPSSSADGNIRELGAGLTQTTSSLLDGACFRWDATGSLRAVVSYSTSSQLSLPLTSPLPDLQSEYRIVIAEDSVKFEINGITMVKIFASGSGGATSAEANLHAFARCYNSSSAAAVQSLRISNCTVYSGDWNRNKGWATLRAGSGNNSIQGASGFVSTSGSANIVNAESASIIVPAANGSSAYDYLGGSFTFEPITSAETDYVVFGYQVPSSSVITSGKCLYITGISIDAWNTGATVSTTTLNMLWSLGIGSTSDDLATVDGAGTKAARRVPLGMQYWLANAVIGQPAEQLNKKFESPYVCNAGEYVQLIVKMPLATAQAGAEWIRGMVAINGYWE